MIIFQNADIEVEFRGAQDGLNEVSVRVLNPNYFVPITHCTTSYPRSLVETIVKIYSPAYVCDEILRDESPDYVRRSLKYDLLGYVKPEYFQGKRILDFGCGAGASTSNLATMFPASRFVGVELNESTLEVARLRAKHHGLENVDYIVSPDPQSLPDEIGGFDVILLNAVYEHLLPSERRTLLPLLWSHLSEGGLLFVRESPYRYSLVEGHTTGLMFINYMPDRLAGWYARRYSPRNLQNCDWNTLLRNGIRGGTMSEIREILNKVGLVEVLNPCRFGARDRIDLNHAKRLGVEDLASYQGSLGMRFHASRLIKAASGIESVALSLALRKIR